MGEGEQLCGTAGRGTERKPGQAVKLGDVLSELMQARISPQRERADSITQAWSWLLPKELYEHCCLADISGGEIEVRADSPSYVYELQLCGAELLEQLQRQCPRARIKKIKFTVG